MSRDPADRPPEPVHVRGKLANVTMVPGKEGGTPTARMRVDVPAASLGDLGNLAAMVGPEVDVSIVMAQLTLVFGDE